jgi:hypothetical protein
MFLNLEIYGILFQLPREYEDGVISVSPPTHVARNRPGTLGRARGADGRCTTPAIARASDALLPEVLLRPWSVGDRFPGDNPLYHQETVRQKITKKAEEKLKTAY